MDDTMARIEELHAADQAAAKINDIRTLLGLWTEDGVLLQPGQEPIRGKASIGTFLESQLEEMKQVEILKYEHHFEEVCILGEWAYEWGTFDGAYRMKSGGGVIQQRARLFRILRRQQDASWRCSRAIWHELPPHNQD